MGIGREVGDAYISVHGDLSDFRDDLNKAQPDVAKAAKRAASDFSEEWAKRIEADVDGKWGSIVDAMYSDKKVDWDRLFGKFDSKNLDEAQEKTQAFLLSMRQFGKLSKEEYDGAKKALAGTVDLMRERQDADEAHKRELEEIARLNEAMLEGEQKAAGIRKRLHEDAIRENERWARTFEGMRKNAFITGMEADFRKLATAVNDVDLDRFAKQFTSLDEMGARVADVTNEMTKQGRISEENGDLMTANVERYINATEELNRITRRTTAEVERSKLEAERFKRSLEGMMELSRNNTMERDFKNIADALSSGDWSVIARGHRDMSTLRDRTMEVSREMRDMGRITDEQFTRIGATLDAMGTNAAAFNVRFKDTNKVMRSTREDSDRMLRNLRLMGAAFDNIGKKIAGMSGFNLIGDMLRTGKEFIQNLDRNMVKIGQMVLLVGTLGGVIGSALGGIAVIGQDLAKLASIAWLSPAFLTGMGIGMGVLVASFKDLKTVLKDLGPQFSRLQDSISAKFWSQAEGPIRELTASLFPTLNTQLGITADRMGDLVGEFARAFKGAATPERTTVMFERMNDALATLKRGVAPLTRAFVTLGEVGSKYFGRAADALVGMSEHFDRFIDNAAKNGDLDRWIENAIDGFKDVGRAISGAVGIFNAIGDAARRAGAGGLKGFADALQRASDIMNSDRFQGNMTHLFRGFGFLVDHVVTGIQNLGPAIEKAIPTIVGALDTVGQVVERIMGYFGEVISNPEFLSGVQNFMAGLRQAVDKMAPAIEPMARSLGGLLDLMGRLLPPIADLIAHIVVTLGPMFDRALTAIEPLIKPVQDLAKAVVDNLAPIFKVLVDEVLPPLVRLFGELIPWVQKLVEFITPALAETAKSVGDGLTKMGDGMKHFNDWAAPGVPLLERVRDEMKKIEGIDPGTGNPILDWSLKMGLALAAASDKAKGIGALFQRLTAAWQTGFTGFVRIIETITSPEKMFRLIADIGINIAIGLNLLGAHIKTEWDKMWTTLDLGFGVFRTMIGEKIEEIKAAAGDIIEGFLSGFRENQTLKDIARFFTLWFEDVRTFFGIHSPSTLMFEAAGHIVDGFVNGFGQLLAKVGEIWNGMGVWITTKLGEIKTNIDTFIADTILNWNTFWGGVRDKVVEIWNAVWTWISTKVGEIQNNIGSFINDVRNNWNGFWQGVWQKVSEIWSQVTGWISAKVGEIRGNIDRFIGSVRGSWDSFWGGLPGFVERAWTNITTGVQSGISTVIGFVTGLPGKILGALGNFGSLLWNAGSAIITSLANGLKASWGQVTDFVGGIASWIAENKGPLSYDRKLLVPAGKAIMDGLSTGLESRITGLLGTLRTITDTISDAVTAGFAHSKMYLAGADAALGIAEGLKSNSATIAGVLDSIIPAPSTMLSVSGSGSPGVGTPTPAKVVNIETLNMPVHTPTKDPEIVAEKVIDGFASFSNF